MGSRAGDFHTESTQISLSGSSAAGTNGTEIQLEDSPSSQFFLPHAPNTFHLSAPASSASVAPPQPQVTIPTERERELLDRRNNWVFMTAEEMMGTDSQKDDSLGGKYEKDGQEKKNTTAMERYYQRLSDTDQQQATNSPANKFDPDTWTKANIPFPAGGVQPANGSLNPSAELGVFQPTRTAMFPDVFARDQNATALTPAEVQLKADQEAHMESFKQLWDIDKAPTTVAVSASPAPVQASSGPVFGSQESQPTTLTPGAPPVNTGGGFGQIITPVQPSTISTLRAHSSPPRPNFAPISSPF